jgi:FHS family L-fucose permease-like MFS transporter
MHQHPRQPAAFGYLTALFFLWGFITCLNDLLIPLLKKAFALSYLEAMLVQTAFFGAYFLVSLGYFLLSVTVGDPIARMGYRKGLVLGLAIGALGCLLFYPAAHFRAYPLFLGALFVLASGITVIQIAANPYVAILGPAETASSRLNLAQGLNSLGYVLAPMIGGFFLLNGGAAQGAEDVQLPYLGLALSFAVLAVVFFKLPLPEPIAEGQQVRDWGLLREPSLLLGMGAIFCYVGAEVAVGSFFVNYLSLDGILPAEMVGPAPEGVSAKSHVEGFAKNFLSFYWGGLMIGRFMGAIKLNPDISPIKKAAYMLGAALAGLLVIYLSASRDWVAGRTLLQLADVWPYFALVGLSYGFFVFGGSRAGQMVGFFALIIVGLLLGAIFLPGRYAMWALIGVGLFNSVMWSNLFTKAIEGLGKRTAMGSSLLVMMIVGGALVPPAQGLLADWLHGATGSEELGVRYSLLLIMACYVYLAFFGLYRRTAS